jgi:hypothetical protein
MHIVSTRVGAWVLTFAALGLLGGCGSTRFAPTDAAGIHTIQLAGFAEPDYTITRRFVLNTSTAEPRDNVDFGTLLANSGLHLGAETKAAIAAALRKDGYQIDDGTGSADAILEVKFGGVPPNGLPMYESAAAGFKPEFSVDAALKDAKTKRNLFHQFYTYRDNSISPIDGTILLKPDPQFEFGRAEDLYADPKRAADGFRAAVPLVAESIGTLLSKQP